MINDDPALRDLSEVADAIAAGRLTSVQATEACLARIEIWQPRTNAFLRLYKEKALEQARAMDRELAAGKRRGPLHGVPMAHKDMYYRKGERSTGGSAIRRDWTAPVTATALQKLDAAGVVELGFLNMAEFAAGPTGHNVHHGHCRNPWDSSRVTGGRSSGSGASVAARMVYGALGSDTGGSIRLPASACGVVGMKATYGRVSRAGAVARSWSLDHVGPLTRTVRDNARMLGILAGHDPDDSTTSEKPVPDYEALLEGGVNGLRIGLALPNDGPAPLDAQVGARGAGRRRCAGPARRQDHGREAARLHRALSRGRGDGEVRGGRHAPAVDGEDSRALRQPGAHAHGGGLLHSGDALHRRAAPAQPFREGVPRHRDGRRRCRAAAGHPLPDPDHRGDRHGNQGRAGRAEDGGGLHRPHAPVQYARHCRPCRCPAASTPTARRSGCSWSAGRSTRRCSTASATPTRARPTITGRCRRSR